MGKKILVIDDEPDLVDFVKNWLESKGYEVITAHDGPEGLKKAGEEKPSLVILDVKMPGMDGFEVLDQLRDNPETQYLPIVILTQRRETGSLFKAKEMGTTDYIMKPFKLEELLEMVNRYVLYTKGE